MLFKKEKVNASIYFRIFTVIIITAIAITISALAAGGWFLTRNITRSIEDHLLVAIDIADQYVTTEIELLKLMAADIAKDINLSYQNGEHEGSLYRALSQHPRFIGLAVFDDNTLLDIWGETVIPESLIDEPFMRIAVGGGQAVSTTMYCNNGSSDNSTLVMYVSAPINDELVLAAVLPGLFFNNLMAQINFWQSGHLYTWDEEGTVISNPRTHWVQQRYNFFEMAEEDSSYKGVASVVARGISGERGIGLYSISDIPRLCAFRPISSQNENWSLGIVAPLPESQLKDIPSGLILMGTITLVLSIVAAIAAAFVLKRPYEEVDRLLKAAEVASISKSTFLANMSHEIRTPMNSIMGFSELAMDGEIAVKTRDYLDKIRTNAEWLLQIINDILDISKVESGKMELEKIPFDIHDLFSSCRTLIMPKAVEKGIVLHFYAEPSFNKKPLGDPTRLRQVFINLLSNAVKFTNSGMIKLLSVVKDVSDKTVTLHFEVKDSGIGMTPEQKVKVFEPFTQAESGITRKYGGTGLGLAITKNIIELMGGKLRVESTLGLGTKFDFDLTFDTIEASDDDLLEQNIALNNIEKPLFEGEILLCEDNTMNQQVITEHLARVGLKTVVADNGKIGVEMVKSRMERSQFSDEKQFDLIFMDIHMPVMDGFEASAKILELNQGIPLVAMTANVMSSDWEIYKRSGMNDCVGKPFTSQELWHCLLKYLKPISGGTIQRDTYTVSPQIEKSHQLMFLKANKNVFNELVTALEANDIEQAHMIAHNLKSNAGQIEKKLLQQAASEVELRLKDGRNLVAPGQLAKLESELNIVFAELMPLLDE